MLCYNRSLKTRFYNRGHKVHIQPELKLNLEKRLVPIHVRLV